MSAEIPGRTEAETALVVIDMVNDLDFEDGPALLEPALAAARRVGRLAGEARRQGVAVVYVNDNFGQWHSERSRLVGHATREASRGKDLTALIAPEKDDFFVIKPQFSGFYATNLAVLLPRLGATRLILTGIATDICVLFTAADAHMREYKLWVPADCTASVSSDRARWALDTMRATMNARTDASDRLDLRDWLDRANA